MNRRLDIAALIFSLASLSGMGFAADLVSGTPANVEEGDPTTYIEVVYYDASYPSLLGLSDPAHSGAIQPWNLIGSNTVLSSANQPNPADFPPNPCLIRNPSAPLTGQASCRAGRMFYRVISGADPGQAQACLRLQPNGKCNTESGTPSAWTEIPGIAYDQGGLFDRQRTAHGQLLTDSEFAVKNMLGIRVSQAIVGAAKDNSNPVIPGLVTKTGAWGAVIHYVHGIDAVSGSSDSNFNSGMSVASAKMSAAYATPASLNLNELCQLNTRYANQIRFDKRVYANGFDSYVFLQKDKRLVRAVKNPPREVLNLSGGSSVATASTLPATQAQIDSLLSAKIDFSFDFRDPQAKNPYSETVYNGECSGFDPLRWAKTYKVIANGPTLYGPSVDRPTLRCGASQISAAAGAITVPTPSLSPLFAGLAMIGDSDIDVAHLRENTASPTHGDNLFRPACQINQGGGVFTLFDKSVPLQPSGFGATGVASKIPLSAQINLASGMNASGTRFFSALRLARQSGTQPTGQVGAYIVDAIGFKASEDPAGKSSTPVYNSGGIPLTASALQSIPAGMGFSLPSNPAYTANTRFFFGPSCDPWAQSLGMCHYWYTPVSGGCRIDSARINYMVPINDKSRCGQAPDFSNLLGLVSSDPRYQTPAGSTCFKPAYLPTGGVSSVCGPSDPATIASCSGNVSTYVVNEARFHNPGSGCQVYPPPYHIERNSTYNVYYQSFAQPTNYGQPVYVWPAWTQINVVNPPL